MLQLSYDYAEKVRGNLIYIDSYWFSGGGIVLFYDKYDGYKAYIKSVSTINLKSDIDEIASYGDKFSLDALNMLMPHIDLTCKVDEIVPLELTIIKGKR